MKAARVLVVTNMTPRGLYAHNGIFVPRQVEALRRLRPGWTFDMESITGPRGRKDFLFGAARLRRILRAGYDLVHAHYGLTGVTTALAGAKPLVLTLHGGELQVAWQKPLTRFAIRRSAAVISVSEWLASGFPGVRHDVISCGVPTNLFTPRDRTEARRRLGLPLDATIVLFPAVPQQPVKNYPLFQAAIERLRERVPNVLDRALRVDPDEVVWHMAAADVVMLTSHSESGPLVVKEALSVGIPVVAVDVGDVRETLEGVPDCEVVAHDASALAEATLRILGNPQRQTAEAVARRRGRIAELEQDDDTIARKVLAVYDRVLEESGQRRSRRAG